MDKESKIKAFVEKQFLGGRTVRVNEPLFTTGIIDSLGVLELIAFLEREYSIEIDTQRQELKDFDTVQKTATLVTQLVSQQPK